VLIKWSSTCAVLARHQCTGFAELYHNKRSINCWRSYTVWFPSSSPSSSY